MKQFFFILFLLCIVSITSLYSQIKDVRVWVENKHQDATIKVYFDALYSSEVGPHSVLPGEIQAFMVKELTQVRISLYRENIYKETKDFGYFYQIQKDRLFQVLNNKQVIVMTDSELGRQINRLPTEFTRY